MRECDECDETEGVETYPGRSNVSLCPICYHDAIRSGWTPGE